jgi:hypothetical protein
MDVMEVLQEYFFKKKVKTSGRENNAEVSYTCGCGSAAGKRDSGTSSHDLSTYVWCTDGDGIGISANIRTDEDDCFHCRKSRSIRKQGNVQSQNKGAKAESRGRMCDASTSTFDLSTFIWDTEGDLYIREAGYDEGMENKGLDKVLVLPHVVLLIAWKLYFGMTIICNDLLI